MKEIWKYISIGLIVLLVGVFSISMYTQNQLKDRIIALQEQRPDTTYVEIHDTVQFDSVIVKWKTKTKNDSIYVLDTFLVNDTVTIVKEKICSLDTFSVNEEYKDSIIEATIKIEGRGVYEKTYIDSLTLNYNINTEVLIPKKKCCWLRRLFCGCD